MGAPSPNARIGDGASSHSRGLARRRAVVEPQAVSAHRDLLLAVMGLIVLPSMNGAVTSGVLARRGPGGHGEEPGFIQSKTRLDARSVFATS